MIFAGTKTVELRRSRPKISVGDLVLVYVSSPTKELQGAFEVGKMISAAPSTLWRKVGKQSGITRTEFLNYFRGKTKAHGLVIKRAWKLSGSIGLSTLRRRKGGFRPPQSFHYISRNRPSPLPSTVIPQNN
jgi:predicted transcriptional regulator